MLRLECDRAPGAGRVAVMMRLSSGVQLSVYV